MNRNSKVLYAAIIISTACLVLLLSCHKNSSNPSVVPIPALLNGILYFKSFYTGGTDSVPSANRTVYISYGNPVKHDTSNAFYSVQTDLNGKFSFALPNPAIHYTVFTEFADTSSRSFMPVYDGSVTTDLPYDTSKLYQLTAVIDSTNRNGLNIIAEDVNGQILPGVLVILYTSGIVAQSDSGFSGIASFEKITTDSLGKAFVSQLPPGPTYINAVLPLSGNSKLALQNFGEIIREKGIRTDTLKLK